MSKKILIVEDEFIVANDLRLTLIQAGYRVTGIAISAEEATAFLQQDQPDLVILDIRLENELSGIDIARKLRAENIAFIYLSANSNQQVLEAAKTTEPYGFLVKPFREQDLLITLDIAWYRHTHSLESKLRREEQLQKQLTAISNETLGIADKMRKVASALQSFIPFDYFTTGLRPADGEHFNDAGFLRIGFDEYQFIGEKELMTITGISKNDLYKIMGNSPAGIFSAEDKVTTPQQKLVFTHFRMQSCLVFPVALGYGLFAQYAFFSRQAAIYTNDHITLLGRLKIALEEWAEKTFHYGIAINELVSANETVRHPGFNNIIGNHHLLLSALDLIVQVAPYNTSVLILGESGTGKESVAKAVHQFSSRKNGPFVKVNCAAIPPTLIESELFGHEKGAFTGAIEKRKGKFEMADGGTIFLDEIGELPVAMQVKLLRVLQEREIEYVGGKGPVKINVRIVAATHRNLEKEVAAGNFRLDLYYRLNVFPVTLPPLRQRRTDIEALAVCFANKFSQQFKKTHNGISAGMLEELKRYDWPGNIRELENVIEQSVVVNDGKSPLQLARVLTAGPANSIDNIKQQQLQEERAYIIAVLKKTKGRIRGVNGAAEMMNIKPTTLDSKMIRLNIRRQDFS